MFVIGQRLTGPHSVFQFHVLQVQELVIDEEQIGCFGESYDCGSVLLGQLLHACLNRKNARDELLQLIVMSRTLDQLFFLDSEFTFEEFAFEIFYESGVYAHEIWLEFL